MSATTITQFAMKLLHKIAAVLVTLLLYGVIVVLQSPKARADMSIEITQGSVAASSTCVLPCDHALARPGPRDTLAIR